MKPLDVTFSVECHSEHAFAVWTTRTAAWWPLDHTVSGEKGLSITFEPEVGGRIFERAPDGVEHDRGEILTWDPPRALSYRWFISGGPTDATDVAITFTAEGESTTVAIQQTGWERLKADGPKKRAANQRGWNALLRPYQHACTTLPTAPDR